MERTLVLPDLFEETCQLNPEAEAVSMQTENACLKMTYSEINLLSNIIANVLIANNCASRFIGVVASSSVHIPAILLGIMKVPSSFVPIDLHSNSDLNDLIFKRLDVHHVICVTSDFKKFKNVLAEQFHMKCVNTSDLDAYGIVVMKRDAGHKQEVLSNCGIAYAMHTSGSTGQPKVIRVPHKCILPNITHLRTKLKVTKSDVVFMASPLTFDTSIVEIFLALSTGAVLFMVSKATKVMPRKLAKALQDNNVTIIQATPSLILRIGADVLRETILRKDTQLRALILGGEQCPLPAVISTWREGGNVTEFWNIYGLTEVSCWASLYNIPQQHINNGVNSSVPLGEPLLGTTLEVRDDRGQAINTGKGHLFLGGERVCLLEDELDIVPDTMRPTGDVVQISPEGLLYLGRIDHQIKRNGQRINLSQLTQVISAIKQVRCCCMLHEESTDQLLLFVVPDTSFENSHMTFYNELENRLPSSCLPEHVYLIDQLPLTSHGKVDTRSLLQRKALVKAGNYTNALSSDELKRLWKNILKIEGEIKSGSNFILLGGDSFQAVRLSNKIEQATGRTFTHLLDYILHKSFDEILQLVGINKLSCEDNTAGYAMPSQITDLRFTTYSQFNPEKNLERKRKSTEICECQAKESKNINNLNQAENESKKHWFVSRGSNRLMYLKNKLVTNRKKEETEKKERKTQGTEDIKRQIHVLNLQEKWKYDSDKCIDASPLLVGSYDCSTVVYIGSHSHTFHAISFESGLRVWSTTLGGRVESSACISRCSSFVIVGCYDHSVYVLNAKSGEIAWSWKTGGEVKSSAIVHPHSGVVYIGSHDQYLYALDIINKECVFSTYCCGGSVFSSPCIDVTMDTLYAATLGGVLISIHCLSGKVQWKRNIGKAIFSSPAVTELGVIVGCVDHYLYHISSSNQIVWSFKTGAEIFSSPCVHLFTNQVSAIGSHDTSCAREVLFPDQVIVIGSHDTHIYCIKKSSGKLAWKFKSPSPIYSTPFIFQNESLQRETGEQFFIVCCCTKGVLFILGLSLGRLLLSQELSGEIFSSPIVYNKNILVGCRDDNIYNLEVLNKTCF